MGEGRFTAVERTLPVETVVLGVDEYTTCTLDLNERRASVVGAGGVTIRRQERGPIFRAQSSFSLDELRTGAAPPARPMERQAAPPDADQALQTLNDQLARARRTLETAEPAWSMIDASRSTSSPRRSKALRMPA